jgi:hypothetical protein
VKEEVKLKIYSRLSSVSSAGLQLLNDVLMKKTEGNLLLMSALEKALQLLKAAITVQKGSIATIQVFFGELRQIVWEIVSLLYGYVAA